MKKRLVNVGTIGHIDHGKPTIHHAISTLLKEPKMNSEKKREALNLPDKKTGGIYDNEYQTGCVDGWNDCLDEVKAMNKAALSEAQPEVAGAVAWRWGNEAAWLLTDEKPVSDDPSIHVEPLYPPSAIEAAVKEKLEAAIAAALAEKVDAEATGTESDIAYNAAIDHAVEAIRAIMESPQPAGVCHAKG